MKVVILAGGKGSRLAGLTETIPKPMVPIGGEPLLGHILSHLSGYGLNHFIVATGYKHEVIEEWVASLTLETELGNVEAVFTGEDTATGGRLRRLATRLSDGPFMVTYGDGLSDVDPLRIMEIHRSEKPAATLLAVHPPGRFGELKFWPEPDPSRPYGPVTLSEKPSNPDVWINGGYIVLEPRVLDLIDGEDTSLEYDVLEKLSSNGEVTALKYEGFWRCIDTPAELAELREIWKSGRAPWSRRT